MYSLLLYSVYFTANEVESVNFKRRSAEVTKVGRQKLAGQPATSTFLDTTIGNTTIGTIGNNTDSTNGRDRRRDRKGIDGRKGRREDWKGSGKCGKNLERTFQIIEKNGEGLEARREPDEVNA
jgi:hypothetical protein